MNIWDYINEAEEKRVELCRQKSGITVPLSAQAVMSQLAEAGWEYYEAPWPHGNWEVFINHIQQILDGDQWRYSADIVILMPAEFDSTPAGVHDGMRDGGSSHKVHGPQRRVYSFIF